MPSLRSLCVCALLIFPTLTPAESIGFVTLGDSLTDTYVGKPYAGANSGWTDLLKSERAGRLNVHNFAQAGSTSGMLFNGTQIPSAVGVIRAGGARHVSLAVGANDVLAFLYQLDPANPATFDPTPHAASLGQNVAATVAALKAEGAKVVLSNVPDVMDTPAMKAALAGNPAAAMLLSAMTAAVNSQLMALAKAEGLPLVELHKLNALGNGPFLLGGVDVQSLLYSVDGFHPSTIGAGLLANVQLEALATYGLDVPRLSDAEILAKAGLTAADPLAAFDAGAYVAHSTPEPSSLLLLGIGAAALFAARRRRRQMSTITSASQPASVRSSLRSW